MSDFPLVLNPDTIPGVLKRLGIQLKGDGELNMLAGAPQRICDQILNSTVTAAASGVISADDSAKLTTALTGCNVGTGACE